MNSLRTITVLAGEFKLEFLLAGGHAVIGHGYARNTFDLDLIIRRSDQPRWRELAGQAGYKLFREGPGFLQFSPGHQEFLPLDLMLVSDDTFTKLIADAVAAPAGACGARMVSLSHLLALKCHALKHGHAGRIVKDADDVIRLVQANRLDVNEPRLRDLLLKYGTVEFYENSKEPVAKPDPEELGFPDWSGMDDSTSRLSIDAAFDLPELYRSWFPELARDSRLLDRQKCEVEFVL